MTREEFHAQEREAAGREGMDSETFDRTCRTYPCWCRDENCPGWQTLTEREVDIIVATSLAENWAPLRPPRSVGKRQQSE